MAGADAYPDNACTLSALTCPSVMNFTNVSATAPTLSLSVRPGGGLMTDVAAAAGAPGWVPMFSDSTQRPSTLTNQLKRVELQNRVGRGSCTDPFGGPCCSPQTDVAD